MATKEPQGACHSQGKEMSVRIACVFAVAFYTLPKPSQSQVCSTEKMENFTIDIKAAFSKGIRGEEPVFASSWEACVDVCCLGADSERCNYVVFNTRSKGNYTNCYLFYYPTYETCPMRQASGLVTYRMIKDVKPTPPPPVQLSPSAVTGKPLPAATAVFRPHLPSSPPLHGSGPVQQPVLPKSVGIVNQHPRGRRLNGTKILGSTMEPQLKSWLSPQTPNAVEPGVPTVQPTVKSPPLTSGTQAGTIIPHVTLGNATTTRPTTAHHKNAPWATANLRRRNVTVPNLSTAAGSSPWSLRPLLVKVSSASLHDVHLGIEHQGLEGDLLNGNPGKAPSPRFGDEGILIAAFLLGVTFFLLVIALVGRKMLESLRRRRYTKLDYLINGMYANM